MFCHYYPVQCTTHELLSSSGPASQRACQIIPSLYLNSAVNTCVCEKYSYLTIAIIVGGHEGKRFSDVQDREKTQEDAFKQFYIGWLI